MYEWTRDITRLTLAHLFTTVCSFVRRFVRSFIELMQTLTILCRYRREGARLILDIGTRMGLRFDTIWTGVVYFHRFYMFRSFKDFKRYVTATCCLFLGKIVLKQSLPVDTLS